MSIASIMRIRTTPSLVRITCTRYNHRGM